MLLPSADIVIDAGHGGIDGGTSEGSLLEKDINLAMGRKLYDHLTGLGYRTVLDRTGDYALSEDNQWMPNPSRHLRDLGQRAGIANLLHPRVVLSLHVNTSSRTGKSGGVVLYSKVNPESHQLSRLLQNSLNRVYGTNNVPVLGKTFYILKRIKSPTVIVELGFLSNAADRARLTSPKGQDELVQALGEAVRQFWSLPADSGDASS
ncbi:N-acetylmuramoyl-L-alanine amidase [Paenibacillus sp. CC-CFT747]|nr:N-acetylmuramoyl-L-alanine amidase [Paenibacillus sp. CC-CFT747]